MHFGVHFRSIRIKRLNRSQASLLQNSACNGRGDWKTKNKTDDGCLEMGLNCAKLLSSNKPDTEPTPYAAYTTPYRHAIRPYFAAGVISAVAILRGSAERADAVARLSHFSGSFGAHAISAARRHGPA